MVSRNDVAAFINRRLRRFDIALVRPSEQWRAGGLLGRQPQPGPAAPARPPLVRAFGPDGEGGRFDFAVVIPSVLRPSLADALRSVFAQDFPGSVQILVGVDRPRGDAALVEAACRERPPRHGVLLFDPGYSTSRRHGGLHPAWDGGVLRTVLSYLAASSRVAYLDDDNFWAPNHLSSLAAALEGHDWAWSRRWFVDPREKKPLAEDVWESVGPGAGVLGGFVDPSCLAVDKLACEAVLRWWGIPLRHSGSATDADQNIFRILSTQFRGRPTGLATSYYVLTETDALYPARIARIGAAR